MKKLNPRNIFAALAFAAASITFGAQAAEPAEYLKSCEGLNKAELLTAIHEVINSHTASSYDGLYSWFLDTDVRDNGHIWDMYSTKDWGTDFGKKCGSYKNVGDCINREHSFPKSWFNDATPMYTDVFHLYPTDGKVNGQRSNYPFGECTGGIRLPSNNGADALGKLGTCTFAGYSGKVFEPDDEYKGDFARTYFYMAACYNNRIKSWNSDMLAGNSYPAFTSWAVNLLLKWHRQDPVSEKEIKRNDAAFAHQHNRNPFIDHPELAEYVWGNKTADRWTYLASNNPTIIAPADGSEINLGSVAIDNIISKIISVKATGLTSNLTISVSGTGFSCSPTSFTPVGGKVDAQAQLTFSDQKTGTFTGGLILTSGDESNSVVIKATVVEGLRALEATDITTESFRANWLYVGDAYPGNYYKLTVSDASGVLDEYPMMVTATDQSIIIEDLEPATTYFYSLESASGTSNTVAVTTAIPQPSIQIITDIDDLVLTSAVAGEPSEPVELYLDIENIDAEFTISVTEPFEVSDNRMFWATSMILQPEQDRFYIRINASEEGTYMTTIVARADDYVNDDSTINGIVGNKPIVIEDFENYTHEDNEGVSNYNDNGFNYTGNSHNWTFVNAGIWSSDKNFANSGEGVLRLGKQSNSNLTMTTDIHTGVGTVVLYASQWTQSEGATTIGLDYSDDNGTTWKSAGTANVNTTTMAPYSFAVNTPGTVRLRVAQQSGKRMLLDDIAATGYTSSGTTDIADDFYTWDAYAIDGQVTVTTDKAADVAIHNAVTGITHVRTAIGAGATNFALAPGHYIVVIGSQTRRVLVK